VGTEHAHARFPFRGIVLCSGARPSGIIRSASIACVKDFKRHANAAQSWGADCEKLALTLRNRGRYKGLSCASFDALSDSCSTTCLE
jgi:hypothetical protein